MINYKYQKAINAIKNQHLNHQNPTVAIGSNIRILLMKDEPNYTNKTGKILFIDGMGQLHGTWGSLAIIPEEDKFELVK